MSTGSRLGIVICAALSIVGERSACAAGAISGVVTANDASNAPVVGAWVDAYDTAGTWTKAAWTDTNGFYVIEPLAPGDYTIRTVASDYGFVDEWYDNIIAVGWAVPTNAQAVQVVNGSTNGGISFGLADGGSISGAVYDTSSTPLSNIWIDIYMSDGTYQQSGFSDITGEYAIRGIPAGLFYLRTYAYGFNYADEWYDDIPAVGSTVPGGAHAFSVYGGSSTGGADFMLATGAVVTGWVTNAADGSALAGIWVDAYSPDGDWVGSDDTSGSGAYEITGLASGTYYCATYVGESPLVDEWYDDVLAIGYDIPTNATGIVLTEGETRVGVNFGLGAGGAVSGVVTNSAGGAITGVAVHVYSESSEWLQSETTDSGGAYEVSGLPAILVYLRSDAEASNFVDEWYDDVPVVSGDISSNALAVSVSAGVTNTGISFGLQEGGRISGIVTDTNAVGLGGIGVDLYDADAVWVRGATTDAGGSYAMSGVPEGDYYARTEVGASNYVDAWFDGVVVADLDTPSNATQIAVSSGGSVSNIDFALPLGAIVAGSVLETGLVGIAGADVVVYDADYRYIAGASTDYGGFYQVNGLPTGSWVVRTHAASLDYADEWYNNISAVGDSVPVGASPIVLAPGVLSNYVDFVLIESGSIAGSVLGTNATSLEGVVVDAYDVYGNWVMGAETTVDGSYELRGLPTPESYLVRTYVGGTVYADEWFDDEPVAGDSVPPGATMIDLLPGGTTGGVSFALSVAGGLAGAVTDDDSAALADIGVDVYNEGGYWVGGDETDAAGNYQVAGVAPGAHYIRPVAENTYFVHEWFDDVHVSGEPIPPTVAAVVVSSGSTIGGVSFGLGFLIAQVGTVTNDDYSVFWQAASGTAYRVQYSTNLLAGIWTNAPSGSNAIQNSLQTSSVQGILEYQDVSGSTSNRFYRITIE